jgi:hypothetical protein
VPAGSLLKDVQSDVVELAHGVGHKQVPALYDQSLGKFFFRPGAPTPAGAGSVTVPASAAIHVPTSAELDESYWQGIKGSSDASEFSNYTKNFPKGMHVAEAEMMSRRLSRTAAIKTSSPSPPAQSPALRAGGPYRGYFTSSLMPGKFLPGTWIINQDGRVDSLNDFGDRSHGTMDASDPNNIVTKAISHLGAVGGIQRRYPDGSTSTQVISQGKLINGVATGTWSDKFQSGQFQMTVDDGK